jgi:predicted lipoprotein with Yx(FWY)xxD motif
VAVEAGPYGQVLVVGGSGAGPFYPAGSSLYFATVDPLVAGGGSYQPGCLTVVANTAHGPLSCTGSETDFMADWPAFTTDGPPVAGPGVNPALLASVYRADLGKYQVTYAGHPLYLFDPGPGSFFGANFFETVLPLAPWHTAWYLVSPAGRAAPGAANLEAEAPQPGTTYTEPALGAEMLPGVAPGGVAITVYSFSRDTAGQSNCVGACARNFMPVLTTGTPTVQSGVKSSAVGVIHRADGSTQVTYDGHPLYLYSAERALLGPMGPVTTGSSGNGNGAHAFGGPSASSARRRPDGSESARSSVVLPARLSRAGRCPGAALADAVPAVDGRDPDPDHRCIVVPTQSTTARRDRVGRGVRASSGAVSAEVS